MKITCPECSTSFDVPVAMIGPGGKRVRCAHCGHVWLQEPTPEPGAFGGFRPADDDLAKFGRDDTPDDYRHRMITNAAAFGFVVLLMAAGLWLADTMASMRKSQDCVLSGRRNCAPIEAPTGSRY